MQEQSINLFVENFCKHMTVSRANKTAVCGREKRIDNR